MARMNYKVKPPAQQPSDASSLGPPTPLASEPGFLVGDVEVHALAGQKHEMILLPRGYEDRQDFGEDAPWRTDEDGDQHRCWQSTR